jgi:tetratricopeptide (TPR) repeat protein
MRRFRRAYWVALLGAVGLAVAIWWTLEYQNRRMPATQVLLEEATQTFLDVDESRPVPIPNYLGDALFLADVWIRQEQPERAKAVLEKLLRVAKNFGCRCNFCAITRLEVARRYLQVGDVAFAERLAMETLTDEIAYFSLPTQPEPLVAFFQHYLKVKSLAEAQRLAARVPELPEIALSALATALSLNGRYDEARQLWQEIRQQLVATVPDTTTPAPQPRRPELPTLLPYDMLQYYLQMGDIEAAIRLFESVPDNGDWTMLAEKLLEAGKPERALELLATNRIVGTRVRMLVAKHYAKQGRADKAIAVLEQIPSLKDDYALAELAQAAAEGGHFRKALALARELSEGEARSQALQQVALQMVRHGYYGSAYRLSREVQPELLRLSVLTALLRKAVG